MRYLKGKKKIISAWLTLLILCTAWMCNDAVLFAEEAGSEAWMATLDDETKLSAVTIPGTHDTCAQYVSLRYIFQCQDTSVEEQLENGYRYLDIRIALAEKDKEPALVIKHNFTVCRKGASPFSDKIYLEDVIADVEAFLEENPTETVILCMKAENGDDDIAQVQKLLYGQIEKNENRWYLKNEIPTMDEVRGKMVLATRFEDEIGVGEERRGLNFNWIDQGDKTVVDEPYVLSMINETEKLWVQDRFNYNTDDKINAIVDDLENSQAADDTFSLNFTSTTGSKAVGHPKKYATAINRYLMEYDWQQSVSYGILIVDFATEELARCIYQTNDL